MIDENSTLEDVCFAVCSALQAASIEAVLTGGSAATIYAPDVYTSFDADFVLRRTPPAAALRASLATLGYRHVSTHGMFEHPKSRFTIDFPSGPLAVGGQYVQETKTLERGAERLRILTPTDCVKDRLAHYYHWDDLTALQAAVGVARGPHGVEVDHDGLLRWTTEESTSAGKDFVAKLDEFFARAGIDRKPEADEGSPSAVHVLADNLDAMPMLSSDRLALAPFIYLGLSSNSQRPVAVLTKSIEDRINEVVWKVLGSDLQPETKANGILFTSRRIPPADLAEPATQWAARAYVRRDGQLEIRQPQTIDRLPLNQIVEILGKGFAIAAQVFAVQQTRSETSGRLVYKVNRRDGDGFRLAQEADESFSLDFRTSQFEDVAAPLLLYLQRQGGYAGEIDDFTPMLHREWQSYARLFPGGDSRSRWRT